MFTKKPILVLASALLAAEAIAVNMHRQHGHQHLHQKREIVYAHTQVVVHTEWVTVTVYDDEPTSSPAAVFKAGPPTTTSSSSTSTSSTPPPPPPPPPAKETVAPPPASKPQTPVEEQQQQAPPPNPSPDKQQQVRPPPATTAAPPPPVQTPPPSGGGAPSGGNKRGLAYNHANLLPPFMNGGSKISWSYNWGQTSDGLSIGVDYVPMLWGPIPIHTGSWERNAKAAIAGGAKALLSFNECDHGSQCNLDAASAAREHQRYMNPYAGQVLISSPAVTNSNIRGQGLDWLRAWISACNGQCAFDFCAIHWYSPADPKQFLQHMKNAHDACQGKPIWITEFAPIDGDASAFLRAVMSEMDSNPEYSFIQRYSYFMASQGVMLSGTSSLNSVGNTFAYA